MKKIILIAFISIVFVSLGISQESDVKKVSTEKKEDILSVQENEFKNILSKANSELVHLKNKISQLNKAEEPERIVIPIHLDDSSENLEETIDNDKYSLDITSDYTCDEYQISIKFTITNHSEEALDTSFIESLQKNNEEKSLTKTKCTYSYKKDFDIENGTKIELIITINDSNGNKVKIFKIKYKPIKKWKWVTTLGVAAVSIVNSDTYKTEKIDNEFVVTENGSQKLFESTPIMQFSYINSSDNFIGVTPSGGIGFDLDNLSIFGGISLYFGKNVFLTMGTAFHQQLRLDNKYDVGQIVSEEISEDDLNSSYYRVNPFISLTFRLDRNIFKK